MANSIVGALYLGMVAGSVNAGPPPDTLAAQAVPTPQCVVCGPARRDRAARIYDWSNGTITVHREHALHRVPQQRFNEIVSPRRFGMTDQQVDSMTRLGAS